MRIIDADNLQSELTKWFPMASLEGIEAKTLFAQIMQDIDNAPTIGGSNPAKEEAEAEIRELIEEERLLDEKYSTIAGRARE